MTQRVAAAPQPGGRLTGRVAVNALLTDRQRTYLDAHAARTGRSRSAVLRYVIAEGIRQDLLGKLPAALEGDE